jgi:hypothetical protein
VLVSHHDRELEVWTRASDGWTRAVSKPGERASLDTIGADLDVTEVYEAAAEPRE